MGYFDNDNRRKLELDALHEQAVRMAMARQAQQSGGVGGGSIIHQRSSEVSYPDRVEVNFDIGEESMIGFLCNTKDMYNDGDTPIYFGDISIGKGEFNLYLYWNGVNWGLDDDLDAPHRLTGPTTKTSPFGEYVGIGESDGAVATVSEYTGSLEEKCISPINSEISALITSATSWKWIDTPTQIGANTYLASGAVYGVQLNDSPEDKLYGDFQLQANGSFWHITNSTPGSMRLGQNTVTILDVPAAQSFDIDKPQFSLIGNWTTFTGLVIYNSDILHPGSGFTYNA